MKTNYIVILVALIIALLIFLSSLFVVKEGQQALVMQLGEIKKQNDQPKIYLPGLHFKTPIIAEAVYFDSRIQTTAIDKSRIMTAQKKDVNVDYYVKWRISNLEQYYTSTSGITQQAAQLLSQQVNNALRAEFGKRTISDVVSDDRSQIMQALRSAADQSAKPLGIQVIDVRIKAIDLPDEVSNAVFNRMRAERERSAAEHRAEGNSQAEAIRATADADAVVIKAKAREQAALLMAQGDEQAAKIYAQAYNKNADFYALYRSLEAYRNTLSKNNQGVLVLSPNSEFFKYFNNSAGTK